MGISSGATNHNQVQDTVLDIMTTNTGRHGKSEDHEVYEYHHSPTPAHIEEMQQQETQELSLTSQMRKVPTVESDTLIEGSTDTVEGLQVT